MFKEDGKSCNEDGNSRESWVSIFSFLGFPKLATATTQNRPDLQQSFGEFSQKRCAKRRRGGFSLMFCLCFQKFFIKHPKLQ